MSGQGRRADFAQTRTPSKAKGNVVHFNWKRTPAAAGVRSATATEAEAPKPEPARRHLARRRSKEVERGIA